MDFRNMKSKNRLIFFILTMVLMIPTGTAFSLNTVITILMTGWMGHKGLRFILPRELTNSPVINSW